MPKAHVEAPVYGSIVLAAILLKVGVYGLYRIRNLVLSDAAIMLGLLILLGGVLASIFVLTQTDLKSLIAYSRIVHMSAVVGLLLISSSMGSSGSILIRVRHGLARSGLFYLVTIQYSRMGSRSIIISKGLLVILPIIRIL